MFDPDTLDPVAVQAAQAHAMAEFPKESCGFITADGYHPVKNIHKTPHKAFWITPRMIAKYKDAICLIHSHPNGPACPSEADMTHQMQMEKPWGIIVSTREGAEAPFFFGDQVIIPDLINRPFRHGVTDCYSAIRDWYRVKREIVLPEFAREWNWWRDGKDMYLDGFAKAGFREIEVTDVQKHDVWLAIYGQNATRINHGGIVATDGGLAYHHLGGRNPYKAMRIARREPLNVYRDHIRVWLRYDG